MRPTIASSSLVGDVLNVLSVKIVNGGLHSFLFFLFYLIFLFLLFSIFYF